MKSKRPHNNSDSISLNKYISDTGFCSRREADNYIAHGRVTVNDNVAIPGNRVTASDVVEIDGEPLGRKKAVIYIAYNKPKGITSTTDTRDKTNIIDAIGHKERIFPVGRLDKDSEGLIFLTNDGNIVNKILRAGNGHEKEYIVTVDKPLEVDFVPQMSSGVRILGTNTQPCKVSQEGRSTFRITLIQGLNRQIRRMCEALGYKVTMLKRIRIMNVHLAGLAVGHWRYLTADEITGIQRMVADSNKEAAPREAKPLPTQKRLEMAKKAEVPEAAPTSSKKTGEKVPVKKQKSSYKAFQQGGKK